MAAIPGAINRTPAYRNAPRLGQFGYGPKVPQIDIPQSIRELSGIGAYGGALAATGVPILGSMALGLPRLAGGLGETIYDVGSELLHGPVPGQQGRLRSTDPNTPTWGTGTVFDQESGRWVPDPGTGRRTLAEFGKGALGSMQESMLAGAEQMPLGEASLDLMGRAHDYATEMGVPWQTLVAADFLAPLTPPGLAAVGPLARAGRAARKGKTPPGAANTPAHLSPEGQVHMSAPTTLEQGAAQAHAMTTPGQAEAAAQISARGSARAGGGNTYTDKVPDIREMPDHATALAQVKKRVDGRQVHLRKVGGKGDYTGAPTGVHDTASLRKMRRDFDKAVEGGYLHNADWYNRMQEQATRVAPGRETLYSVENALFSPQANPDQNLGFQLQAHSAAELGAPPFGVNKHGKPVVKTSGQLAKHRRYYAGGDPGLSLKTGAFARAIDPNLPPTIGGTHDIWDGRAWGFRETDGGIWNSGFSENQHRFLDYETVRAVDRANRRKMGGRSDWNADEIQASAWGYMNGLDRFNRDNVGKYATLDDAIKDASVNDFFDRYAAHATYESTPSATSQHLPSMQDQTYDLRERYTRDPRSSWVDPETGHDIIYDAAGAYQLPTEPQVGAYYGPAGPEVNPGAVARPLVAFDPVSRDKGARRGVAARDQKMLDAAESARGYIDAQHEVAWNQSNPIGERGSKVGDMNALNVGTGALSPTQTEDLINLAGGLGYKTQGAFPIKTFDATRMMDFQGPSPKVTKDRIAALEKGTAQRLLGPGLGIPATVERSVVDSNLLSFGKNSGKGVGGTGEATRVLLDRLQDPAIPALFAKLDADPRIRQAAMDRLLRDAEYSSQLNTPVRPDIQLAREIIAKYGFSGLKDALDKGVLLPAVALPILAMGLEATRGQGDPDAGL